MKKQILLLLLLCVALSSVAQKQTETLPQGVNYGFSSQEIFMQ